MSSQWGIEQQEALSCMASTAKQNNDTVTLHLLAIAEELANRHKTPATCHCSSSLFAQIAILTHIDSQYEGVDMKRQSEAMESLAHYFLPQLEQAFVEAERRQYMSDLRKEAGL